MNENSKITYSKNDINYVVQQLHNPLFECLSY